MVRAVALDPWLRLPGERDYKWRLLGMICKFSSHQDWKQTHCSIAKDSGLIVLYDVFQDSDYSFLGEHLSEHPNKQQFYSNQETSRSQTESIRPRTRRCHYFLNHQSDSLLWHDFPMSDYHSFMEHVVKVFSYPRHLVSLAYYFGVGGYPRTFPKCYYYSLFRAWEHLSGNGTNPFLFFYIIINQIIIIRM